MFFFTDVPWEAVDKRPWYLGQLPRQLPRKDASSATSKHLKLIHQILILQLQEFVQFLLIDGVHTGARHVLQFPLLKHHRHRRPRQAYSAPILLHNKVETETTIGVTLCKGEKCTVMVCIKSHALRVDPEVGMISRQKTTLETQWIYMNLLIKSNKSIYDMINQYSYIQLLRQAQEWIIGFSRGKCRRLAVFKKWRFPIRTLHNVLVIGARLLHVDHGVKLASKKLIGSHQNKSKWKDGSIPRKKYIPPGYLT